MGQEKIELSIITVCFNSEKTIQKTIESVGNQLTSEVEYLIVDGESEDRTLEIAREAQKKYPLTFISEPDAGIYDAMNKGMKLAKGKWLLYINSDDILKPGVLKRMLPVLMEESQADCIATDVEMRRIVDGVWYRKVWKAEEMSEKVCIYLPFCHQGMYLRKDVMQEMQGFDCDFKIAADWDLVFRMYKAGKKFRILNRLNAEFTEGGASNRKMVLQKHRIRVKNKEYRWIVPGLLWDLKNRFRSWLGRVLLGEKKEKLAVKKNYTKVEE